MHERLRRLKNQKITSLILVIRSIIKPYALLFKKVLLFRIVTFSALGLLLIICFQIAFFGAKRANFNYGNAQACTSSVIFLPNMQKNNNQKYTLHKEGLYKIAGYPFISTRLCFSLKQSPVELTKVKTGISFYGLSFFSRNIELNIPKYPKIDNSLQSKKYVAVTDPIIINLDQSDSTFDYSISANKAKVLCKKQTSKILSCDVKELKLKHAQVYQFKITRQFKGAGVEVLTKIDLPTISPLKIINSSLQDKQTVYDKPKEIILITDKDIRLIDDLKLSADIAGKNKQFKTETKLNKQTITIYIEEDLPRDVNYRLNIEDIHATDGGSLVENYNLNFYTSKGPAVSAISIRDHSVVAGQSFYLNFDQDLLPSQDYSKYISIEANGKSIPINVASKASRVEIKTVEPMQKCTIFSVKVNPGLLSLYNISSGASYAFKSRVSCFEQFTIGSSARGRAINAYKFGDGQNLILFAGVLHGDESNVKSLLEKWIDEIEGNPERLPINRSIVVIPVLNPDGYASKSRLNANGIDLNRNFPADNWRSAIKLPSGQLIAQGGGAEALSEPEAKAIANYISSASPKLVMSYHSQGPIVVGNDSGSANSLASTYASKSSYPFRTNANIGNYFNYDTTGAFEDWTHDKLDKPTILVELSSRNNDEFTRNRTAMWLMAQSP